MSNTKHTPGPWHISSASKNAINAERNNKPIGIGTTYYDHDSVYFIGQDEAIANASLIAAAPELLDICESILAEVDYEGLQLESGRVAKLRAVIAKATAQ